MKTRALLVVGPALLLGCGSSTDGSSLFNAGTSHAGAAGSTDAGAAGAGGSAGASGAANGGSGPSSGGGSVGGALGTGGSGGSSGASAGGAVGNGGSQSVRDASPPGDDASALGPTPGTIFCAGQPCTIAGLPTNECCVGPPPFPTGCFPSFPGCVNGGGLPIACDDAADCSAGLVCCGNLSGQNAGAHCTSTCSSPSVQLCRTHAECISGSCLPMAQSPEYSACQ